MQKEDRNFWIIIFALLLLTRIPSAAQYLSIDNVNLALALENFDPRIHQPQPPGYPLFVAVARVFNFFFRDAGRTFLVLSVVTSALCLPVIAALGRRMFSPWVGRAAALLLLVNPPFWQSALDGPLRHNLALFSLLTAYCAWRCWNGEKQFVFWGAVSLGVGSGFRPDLVAYLFPIWFLSAWMGTRSVLSVLRGLATMAAVALVWIGAMAYAVGGPTVLVNLLSTYLTDQSAGESVVLGAASAGWLHQISRLVIWNGLAVVGWVWTVPLVLRAKDRLGLFSAQSVFMLTWLLPGLLLQALIHVAAPGHTLFSAPALCLLGGYFMYAALPAAQVREAGLAAALVVNLLFFLNYFPLPLPGGPTTGLASLKNAVAFSTFESSINSVRWLDDISRITMDEIHKFTPSDRPVVIVSSDVHLVDWFMNWRIVRYYLPMDHIWVVADQVKPNLTQHVVYDKILETKTGDVLQVPIPRGGRVLWLLETGGPFHKTLASTGRVAGGGQRVFYTDVDEASTPFRVLNFEFIPGDSGGTQ